ncbi:hypothetical protein [Amycolatopsis jejuensis]|uniref:hypothetical protein n=1 Tax=Amycolatopsis jejuensis TaxID=330084 RepID=UPI000690160A|nr:hypothetical protein [Amycolatopsis jejuensis]
MSTTARLRAGFTVAAVAGLALLGSATAALAADTEDSRATIHEGNVTTCSGAGLTGVNLGPDDLTVTGGGQQDQYVSITAVKPGVTVTAIVVKGGPRYNVYEPGKRGLPVVPPWTQLRSPLNNGGNIPVISHWFACGIKTPPTTTTTPTTTTAPPTTTTTHTAPPSSTAPSTTTTSKTSGSATSAPSTTSAPAVVPAGNEKGTGGGLASTGFDNAWLFWVAGLLIVAGGGLLAFLKLRRRGSSE